jgi:hypothetical protein
VPTGRSIVAVQTSNASAYRRVAIPHLPEHLARSLTLKPWVTRRPSITLAPCRTARVSDSHVHDHGLVG